MITNNNLLSGWVGESFLTSVYWFSTWRTGELCFFSSFMGGFLNKVFDAQHFFTCILSYIHTHINNVIVNDDWVISISGGLLLEGFPELSLFSLAQLSDETSLNYKYFPIDEPHFTLVSHAIYTHFNVISLMNKVFSKIMSGGFPRARLGYLRLNLVMKQAST